jgi:beta-N-acetylhexosaminidase
MRILGELGDVDLVQRAAFTVARGLAAMGINCNFAPVLDVASNPRNPVIGDRSFSNDPKLVANMGLAFARGLSQGGILACGKHFPGHGDTLLDSHFDLPVVSRPRESLNSIELSPFHEAVAQSIDALMTAHVVYPELDSAATLATFSKPILTHLLRDSWGYQGLLFSDDLDMKAVSARYSLEAGALSAIRAGCDMLLICHSTGAVDRVLDALVKEAETDPQFCERALQAAQRSVASRHRCPPRPATELRVLEQVLASDESNQLFRELHERVKMPTT